MQDYSTVVFIAIIGVGLLLFKGLESIYDRGYETGYKWGQIDAYNNKYKYQLRTDSLSGEKEIWVKGE